MTTPKHGYQRFPFDRLHSESVERPKDLEYKPLLGGDLTPAAARAQMAEDVRKWKRNGWIEGDEFEDFEDRPSPITLHALHEHIGELSVLRDYILTARGFGLPLSGLERAALGILSAQIVEGSTMFRSGVTATELDRFAAANVVRTDVVRDLLETNVQDQARSYRECKEDRHGH
jgi:hypothetical protein